MDFKNRTDLVGSTTQAVVNSLDVLNETPIVGNVTTPTTGDLKRRIFDTFPTQNRAVTKADYENLANRMPAKFGSIKRVSIQRDPNSAKRNLNVYVLSEDSYGKLVKTTRKIEFACVCLVNTLQTSHQPLSANHFLQRYDEKSVFSPG